jgi:short-subunit dehydrogenase
METALITGASSGLGEVFANLFAKDGINLVISASPRSEKKLQELATSLEKKYKITVTPITLDLSEQVAGKQLYDAVKSKNIQIDYLVNNAGYGIVGLKLQDYEPEIFKRMLQLNIMTLSELTMLYVPEMVQRKHGCVLNISSIAGYVVPHGLEAGYAASKAFVVSFSEAVAMDLEGTGVTCTHLAPGPTRTAFFTTAGLQNQSRLNSIFMTADVVAKAGYDAMKKGKVTVMPGFTNKAMAFFTKFSPSKKLIAKSSGFYVDRGKYN